MLPPLLALSSTPVVSLFDEPVTFMLALWGAGLALGFKGEASAIERCYNWAANTRVTRGELKWLYSADAGIGYVYVACRDDLIAGLVAQFRAELIMARAIPPLKDEWLLDEDGDEIAHLLEYDETQLAALAGAKATRFLDEKLVHENFTGGRLPDLAPIYSVATARFHVSHDE